MKIKYVGGSAVVTVNDILDPRYNRWLQNETKDVPDYDIDVLDLHHTGSRMSAISAVLNCGPAFVDESTGRNPLFTCTKSGCTNPTDHDFFRPEHETIEYVVDDDRVCVEHFLIANPQWLAYHIERGLPSDVRHRVDLALAPAPTVAPAVAPPSPPASPASVIAEPKTASQE